MKKKLITLLAISLLLLPIQSCFAGNFFTDLNSVYNKISKNIPSSQSENNTKTSTKQLTPNNLGNETVNNLFLQAVEEKNMGLVQMLVEEKGANVNYVRGGQAGYPSGTPFLIAIKQNNIEMVKYLISKGADVNMKIFQNNGDSTPLYNALYTRNLEMVQTIVEAGADINFTLSSSFSWGRTVIFALVGSNFPSDNPNNIEIFNYLVSKGAAIDKTDIYGNTLLICSVQSNNIPITKFLLNAGINPNKRNSDGKLALDYTRNQEIINILLPVTDLK